MKKVMWQEMRRTEFEEAVKENAVIIIPVGSTEQHGEHLPVNTDVNCCYSIAKKAAETVDDFPVLILPPVWTGYSPHHMAYHGTITVKLDTFLELLSGIAKSVHAHGFKNILFLNGHGGNTPAVAVMRNKLSGEEGFPVIGYDYFALPGVAQEMKRLIETDKGVIGHSGECETSMELFLQPELVDESKAKWMPGVKGNPIAGSRSKGERLFNFIVGSLVQVLRDYHSGKLENDLVWRKEITG
jgi:creatinine amidohydrolase